MHKTKNNQPVFKDFLQQNISFEDWNSLHEKLGVSKKMLTAIIMEPKRLSASQLMIILMISGKSFEDIKTYL